MVQKKEPGVFKLENGFWGYRFTVMVNGQRISRKKTTDAQGNKLKTRKQATKARDAAIIQVHIEAERANTIIRKTIAEVFAEYCKNGRADRAYQTIRKQDSIWENHLKDRFGRRGVSALGKNRRSQRGRNQ